MSVFDDPSFVEQSKADLRRYIDTGVMPKEWRDDRRAGPPPGFRPPICFADWELMVVCDAIRRDGHEYAKTAARLIPRTQGAVLEKVRAEGGREAFLRKYDRSRE